MTLRNRRIFVACLIALIVLAHVGLWRSTMDLQAKIAFTTLNAVGWAIVLVPILFVDRWLDAIRRRNAENSDTDT